MTSASFSASSSSAAPASSASNRDGSIGSMKSIHSAPTTPIFSRKMSTRLPSSAQFLPRSPDCVATNLVGTPPQPQQQQHRKGGQAGEGDDETSNNSAILGSPKPIPASSPILFRRLTRSRSEGVARMAAMPTISLTPPRTASMTTKKISPQHVERGDAQYVMARSASQMGADDLPGLSFADIRRLGLDED